jgi:hypothetical protein
MFSINNHVTLQAEALKKLGLGFRASSSHCNNGLWLNSIDSYLELFYLNLDKLALRVNFKF